MFMYFRGMTPDEDGLPKTGRAARRLGVRIPKDIPVDPEGRVHADCLRDAMDPLWYGLTEEEHALLDARTIVDTLD